MLLLLNFGHSCLHILFGWIIFVLLQVKSIKEMRKSFEKLPSSLPAANKWKWTSREIGTLTDIFVIQPMLILYFLGLHLRLFIIHSALTPAVCSRRPHIPHHFVHSCDTWIKCGTILKCVTDLLPNAKVEFTTPFKYLTFIMFSRKHCPSFNKRNGFLMYKMYEVQCENCISILY